MGAAQQLSTAAATDVSFLNPSLGSLNCQWGGGRIECMLPGCRVARLLRRTPGPFVRTLGLVRSSRNGEWYVRPVVACELREEAELCNRDVHNGRVVG